MIKFHRQKLKVVRGEILTKIAKRKENKLIKEMSLWDIRIKWKTDRFQFNDYLVAYMKWIDFPSLTFNKKSSIFQDKVKMWVKENFAH